MKLLYVNPVKLALFCIFLFSSIANSHDFNAGKLEIGHPWARPTAPVVKTGAVYFSITNPSEKAERLLSVNVTPDVAAQIQIHQTKYSHDMAQMRKTKQGLDIAPESTLTLNPGGTHIMLMGLNKQLKQGDKFPMTLEFERSGEITIEVWVEEATAKDKVQSSHKHH